VRTGAGRPEGRPEKAPKSFENPGSRKGKNPDGPEQE